MKTFTQFLTEAPDERNVYVPGNPDPVGKIVFISQVNQTGWLRLTGVSHLLTGDEQKKLARANVVLVPATGYTGYLGAPVKWTAPNGVLVVYCRGQRRSAADEKSGAGSMGLFHDFNPGDEYILPATQNDGPGRRALRAWAAEFMKSSITARSQARQMVRPGD